MTKQTIVRHRHPAHYLMKELENWFDPFQPRSNEEVFASEWTPVVDIKDEKDKFVIHADVPGVKANDIEVNLEKGILTIKGKREYEQKEEKDNYVHVERSKGSFMRRFSLPDSVDADNIEASTKDGVLEIILHKTRESGARKITVSEK